MEFRIIVGVTEFWHFEGEGRGKGRRLVGGFLRRGREFQGAVSIKSGVPSAIRRIAPRICD
jgi:hypothetical protein